MFDKLHDLPDDIQNKIFYYLSHKTADLINNEIERLKLNKIAKVRLVYEGFENLEVEIDFKDFFITEYFSN